MKKWINTGIAHINYPMMGVMCCLIFLSLWSCYRVVPAEDAVILFEYAKKLAHTGVITYSTQTAPVEGATDFLWMMAISLGSKLGVDEFISAEFLSVWAMCGLFYLLYRRDIAPQWFILSLILTPYVYATLCGFSALFFTFFYVLGLCFAKTRHRYFYLNLLILCLIRPDGVVWASGLILYRLVDEKKLSLRPLLGSFVVPFLLYWCWRAWYFDEFWPLPFIVKGFHHDEPYLFYRYSLMCILMVAQPIFFSLFFFQNKKKLLKEACLLFIVPCLFYGMMRLEQNVGNRMLAPMFWGWLFCLGTEPSRRIFNQPLGVLFFVLCSAVYSAFITQYTVFSLLKSQRMNVYRLAKKIDEIPPGRMLVSEAGRLAYYTHWHVEDSWGLNTPFYAHQFIRYSDIKRGNYDLIVTHCDLTLLNDTRFYEQFSQKTWGHQSKILLSYLRHEAYDIYLVPYYRQHDVMQKKDEDPPCMRYDVYGVSKTFEYSERLSELLMAHGGLRYQAGLKLLDDTVCRG